MDTFWISQSKNKKSTKQEPGLLSLGSSGLKVMVRSVFKTEKLSRSSRPFASDVEKTTLGSLSESVSAARWPQSDSIFLPRPRSNLKKKRYSFGFYRDFKGTPNLQQKKVRAYSGS